MLYIFIYKEVLQDTHEGGVIFSLDLSNNIYNILFSFDSTGGSNYSGYFATGSLMQASNGKLYGMTTYGGANDGGTIFSFDPMSNTFSKLYDCPPQAFLNGRLPSRSLMQASDGKLYGMTFTGGLFNIGVLFSFDPTSNTYTKLMDFDGSNNGSLPWGSLIQASNGLLYGTTYSGGINDNGVLYSYDIITNSYVKILDFNGAGNGAFSTPNTYPYSFNYYQGDFTLYQGSNGIIYGLTPYGGIYGKGVIYTFDPTSNLYSKIRDLSSPDGIIPVHSFIEIGTPVTPAQINGPLSICAGSTNIYQVIGIAAATSYTWTLPNGWTGTSTSNSINVIAGSTSGNISVVANGSSGSSASQTIAVNISLPAITITGDSNICKGTITTLIASGGISYLWNIGTSSDSLIISPDSTTDYSVTITDINGCTNTKSVKVTVNQLSTDPLTINANPNPVTIGDSTLLSIIGGTLGTGASWKWYAGNCGGILIDSGLNLFASPSTPTLYYARAEGPCDTTNCSNVAVNVVVGLSEEVMIFDFSIFPNPLTQSSMLQIKSELTCNVVVIYNVLGKELIRKNITDNKMEMSIGNLSKGLYFIKLFVDDKQYTRKILLQ